MLHNHKGKPEDLNENVPYSETPTPFEKTNKKWEEYESTEFFKGTPHLPHFRQVAKYPIPMREDYALALMETFLEISQALDDPGKQVEVSELELYKGSLFVLETNGFQVKALIVHVDNLIKKTGKLVETGASQSNDVASEVAENETDVAANVKRKRDPMEKMSDILKLHKKLKGCLERTTEKIALKEKQNAVRKQKILELQEKVFEFEMANEKEENEIAELKEMEEKETAKLESYKMKIRQCAEEIMIAL